MYKVLLVDDERIILDGISNTIDWGSHGTQLIGTARNGIDAYNIIVQEKPHIVISDIKMPGMSGLELISRVHEEHLPVRFILLSGFGEFEYAKKAMHFGIKHYLLKPCNENSIIEALTGEIKEIKKEEEHERMIVNIENRLEKVEPYIQLQLLKEFLTDRWQWQGSWNILKRIFPVEFARQKVQILLIKFEAAIQYEHLNALESMMKNKLKSPLLPLNLGEHLLFLIGGDHDIQGLNQLIYDVRKSFISRYQIDITVVLSDAADVSKTRELYEEALEYLNYRFYTGKGSFITKTDVEEEKPSNLPIVDDQKKLSLKVKQRKLEDALAIVQEIFRKLQALKLDVQLTRSYVIRLYLSVIQSCSNDIMENDVNKISDLLQADTIHEMKEFIEIVITNLITKSLHLPKSEYTAPVKKVLAMIHEQIGNEELSLKWVAKKIYMNPDYLGKLFKQETGERFSNYVTRLRIEKAKKLIENEEDVKVFELAEKVGFGDNPQYFSQVFKKFTGFTPSEYRQIL